MKKRGSSRTLQVSSKEQGRKNPQEQFCPNERCHASDQVGKGNIRVHSQKARRYKCHCCGRTFSARKGTPLYWLKREEGLFEIVMSLLAYGCPEVAIVVTYGLHEATVRNWQAKAGQHCQQVHQHYLERAQLDLGQMQTDEIKVKSQAGVVWLAMAVMVSTRLWLGRWLADNEIGNSSANWSA